MFKSIFILNMVLLANGAHAVPLTCDVLLNQSANQIITAQFIQSFNPRLNHDVETLLYTRDVYNKYKANKNGAATAKFFYRNKPHIIEREVKTVKGERQTIENHNFNKPDDVNEVTRIGLAAAYAEYLCRTQNIELRDISFGLFGGKEIGFLITSGAQRRAEEGVRRTSSAPD